MQIRRSRDEDRDAIAAIILPVIRDGATYPLDRDMGADDALAYWLGRGGTAYVAEEDGVVLGTYYLKPNVAGGGAHVCNCGYMTAAAARGRGIAQAMCEDSLVRARVAGFRAMQFNFVVSTNTGAVRLWHRLGFTEVGRLPGAYRHSDGRYVDALVLYRSLV